MLSEDMVVELQGKIEALVAQLPLDLKSKYDEGFVAGAAAGGIDKIYSQAELDAKIAEALAGVQPELDAVKAELASVKAELDAVKAGVGQQIQDAITAFKADLAQKYADQQVAEQQGETGFGDLLK